MTRHFTNGLTVNFPDRKNKPHYKRMRVTAGPQRGQYVDRIILEAKLRRRIKEGYTVEHSDGNSLNIDPSNLIEVSRPKNSVLRGQRENSKKNNH